jgi:AcrR family transcriptional regulator
MSSAESSDTRAAILRAALGVLTDEGYGALTVRRVAAEAGCSTIGVYTWFGGKDGLIEAILIEGFTSFTAALRRARPGSGPLAKLSAQGRAYRRWALANPMHYRVMFLEAASGFDVSDAVTNAATPAYLCLHDAVREAADRHELATDDVDATALAVWGTVHGLVSLELLGRRPAELSDAGVESRAYELALRLLVGGLRAPAASPTRTRR